MASKNSGGSNGGKSGERATTGGIRKTARDNKLATAAAVGGAVAAGVFLWSRRNRSGDEFGTSSEGQGATDFNAASSGGGESASDASSGEGRSQVEIAQEALALKEGTAS